MRNMFQTVCDKSTLNRHQLYHGEPKFQCDECPEKLRTQKLLTRHKRVHAGELEDVNSCEFCDKKFTSHHSLRNHQHLHHSGPEEGAVCNECGKEFKTYRLMKAHMRVHSKEV